MSQSALQNPAPADDSLSLLERLLEDIVLSPADQDDLALAVNFISSLSPSPSFINQQMAYLSIDTLICGLDEALSSQLDTILHTPEFINLERTWRSLQFLVDHSDARENVKIQILNVTQNEIFNDLSDSPELIRSAMFRKIYTEEFGQFGGQPFGVVICAYEVTSEPMDIAFLRNLSNLGATAHVPFIFSVDCRFFGLTHWQELPALQELDSLFSQIKYTNWLSLRSAENSRYLALVLPGFLARPPYSPKYRPATAFNYIEKTGLADSEYVWGFPSFLLGLKMAESFAKYRWCANITGIDGGGLIEGLPTIEYESMGRIQTRIPLQAIIGEKLEQDMANNGFIAASLLQGGDQAVFYSAPTVLKPKVFSFENGGTEATFNNRVSTLLPYMMIINRLAHYIKVIQRENIGTWKDRKTLEKELNSWLNQYVTDMDSPSPSLRGKRPLRSAKVEVIDLPDYPGWLQMALSIKPHLKFMGAAFTLSLVGRLDLEQFESGKA